MSSTTEYMIFSEFNSLLPKHRQNREGFECRKLGIDKTLEKMAELISTSNNLKRQYHENKVMIDTVAKSIADAEKLGIVEDYKKLTKKTNEMRNEFIELSPSVETSISQVETAKDQIKAMTKSTMEKIKKQLGECAKKNLNLAQTVIDPIFSCEDITDLIKYLDTQGLNLDDFCDLTGIAKKELLSIEKSAECFCQSLLLSAYLASQGPLSIEDKKTTKKKIKKGSETVLPCMSHFDSISSELEGSIAEIVAEIQPAKLKQTENELEGMVRVFNDINDRVAPKVAVKQEQIEKDKNAKQRHKHEYKNKVKIERAKPDYDQYETADSIQPE